jgi:hypothetical protein
MHAKHMVGCLIVAGIVALILVALGAPAGAFAFVLVCPLMMIGMMAVMMNVMRPHDHARTPHDGSSA